MPRPADGPVLPALDQYDAWMDRALDEARAAAAAGDVPVGAVVVQLNEDRTDGVLVAARHNERELTGDPTAHAEVLAIRHAAMTLGRWRLDDCLVVVTLEPCPMCAGALWASRVRSRRRSATLSCAPLAALQPSPGRTLRERATSA